MRYLFLFFMVWPAVMAGGRFHDCVEACPVLVSKESQIADPECRRHLQASDGTSSFLIRGTIVTESTSGQGPPRKLKVTRECLDKRGAIVRQCPMPFQIDSNGRFDQEVWFSSGTMSFCRDAFLVTHQMEERVQLRFRVAGCQDLIVPMLWPWEERTFVMHCLGSN
jgi:hypothetical protein